MVYISSHTTNRIVHSFESESNCWIPFRAFERSLISVFVIVLILFVLVCRTTYALPTDAQIQSYAHTTNRHKKHSEWKLQILSVKSTAYLYTIHTILFIKWTFILLFLSPFIPFQKFLFEFKGFLQLHILNFYLLNLWRLSLFARNFS